MRKTLLYAAMLVCLLGLAGCKISGTITANGSGLEGVKVVLNGGNEQTTETDKDGCYEFTVKPTSDNHFVVTPSKAGYTFLPSQREVSFEENDIIEHVDFIAKLDKRQALIAFYNNTHGDGWDNNNGWKTPPLAEDGFAMPGTEHDWHGIEIDTVSGDVTAIRLPNNNVVGTIPAAIGSLTSLRDIDLSGNKLKGAIPDSIENLSALYALYLADNELYGYIPTCLTALTELSQIYLERNHLCTEDPALIELLDRMSPSWRDQKLDTPCHPVHRVLMELYNATDGPNWKNNDNWGTDAPVETWIGVMPEQQGRFSLHLADNNLNGPLPASICELSGLTMLNLSNNSLTGSIPHDIGNLENLYDLTLSYNKLNGPIPESIGTLSQLGSLALNENELTGYIPATLMNLTSIGYMALERNHLCVEDPDLIAYLDEKSPKWRDQKLDTECDPVRRVLMELYNATDGANWKNSENWGTDAPVETWIGVNPGPQGQFALHLENNNLNGPLPASISELSGLVAINLSNNSLTGSIPQDIGNLQNLYDLNLSFNKLSGPIPDSIGELTLIGNLALTDNELTGYIPKSLMNLDKTYYLSLGYNHLCTEDPDLVAFLDQKSNDWREQKLDTECHPVRRVLMELYNATDGPNWKNSENWGTDAPVESWSGVRVESSGRFSLELPDNNLNGTLPQSICELTGLTRINLSNNALTGPIPQDIGHLKNLYDLNLAFNKLSGPIPDSIGELTLIGNLALTDNELTGYIPKSLMNLDKTYYLSLGYNHLCTEDPDLVAFLDQKSNDWREQKLDTECHPVRRVLMELYNATDGPNWKNSENWGTDAPVESWSGVRVESSGRFSLELPDNNLNGTLPQSICELTGLTRINLSNNALTGPIPQDIGHLKNLYDLNLAFNKLSGPIPDSIGELTLIGNLALTDNELTGYIPKSLMNLDKTYYLSLGYNHLCTEDPDLVAFLDQKSNDWRDGQTDTPCDTK